jgi:hypothetical protein
MSLSLRTILILAILTLTSACNAGRDRQDTLVAAARVHSQLQAGDFAVIYSEAAPRFKSVGSESQFVSQMQQFFLESGKLVKVQEVAYQSGIDSQAGPTHTLDFTVDYQQMQGRERLIFTRSNNGQMQLWKLDVKPKE